MMSDRSDSKKVSRFLFVFIYKELHTICYLIILFKRSLVVHTSARANLFNIFASVKLACSVLILLTCLKLYPQ